MDGGGGGGGGGMTSDKKHNCAGVFVNLAATCSRQNIDCCILKME